MARFHGNVLQFFKITAVFPFFAEIPGRFAPFRIWRLVTSRGGWEMAQTSIHSPPFHAQYSVTRFKNRKERSLQISVVLLVFTMPKGNGEGSKFIYGQGKQKTQNLKE